MMGEVVFVARPADRRRPRARLRERAQDVDARLDRRDASARVVMLAKVWGCDLSRRYVDINAEYMT